MPRDIHTTPEHDRTTPLPWVDDLTPASLTPTALSPTVPDSLHVSGAYPHGWRQRPAEQVDASWLRQVTLLQIAGVTVRLQACLDVPGMGAVLGDQRVHDGAQVWPFAAPLIVIGAVRGPAVVYPDEARASRDELLRQLVEFGVGAAPAWTVDRGHGWTEPSCVAFPAPDQEDPPRDWQTRALGIPRQMGIGTVVRIAEGSIEVLALGGLPSHRYSVVASAEVSVTRDVERRCPMTSAPDAGEYCPMRGGPWTSASIHAAVGWRDLRDRLVEAVGCDTCEGVRYLLQGQVRTGGGPISIVPTPMPTRWLAPDDTRIASVEES